MSDFSQQKWQMIKELANKLYAIRNLLQTFENQVNVQSQPNELNNIQNQLQTEFDITLKALIDLIDSEDA